jgi:hypothetical protein
MLFLEASLILINTNNENRIFVLWKHRYNSYNQIGFIMLDRSTVMRT